MNVLVLDNQPLHVESLVRGLMTRGHQAFSAVDGQKALDQLNRNEPPIDLIITDHSLTLHDSQELIHHIESCGGVPAVIIMTAAGEREEVLNPLSRVCVLFLEKPFSIEKLLSAMDNCMARAKRL